MGDNGNLVEYALQISVLNLTQTNWLKLFILFKTVFNS